MFKMTLLLSALAVATGVAAQQPATPAGIEKRMPATPELKKTDGVYTFGNQKKPKVSVSELAEKGLQAKEVSKTVMSSRLNRALLQGDMGESRLRVETRQRDWSRSRRRPHYTSDHGV